MLAFADPDLDNGPRTDRSATMRMCAVTREVRPIDELIRFVVSPTGEVVPDLKRKLPGRGLWVSASRRAVAEAVRRNQFGKGFKRAVRVGPVLSETTEALLERSLVEALAMAAKAGQVVSGFGKVETALGSDRSRSWSMPPTARRTESANWTPSPGKMPDLTMNRLNFRWSRH